MAAHIDNLKYVDRYVDRRWQNYCFQMKCFYPVCQLPILTHCDTSSKFMTRVLSSIPACSQSGEWIVSECFLMFFFEFLNFLVFDDIYLDLGI